MRHTYILLFALLLFTGCDKFKPSSTDQAAAAKPQRSAADIHLALLPNIDCLPFYYAEARGYYTAAGVSVEILSCGSQTDCDTTLLGGTAEGAYMDQYRQAHLGRKADAYYSWLNTEGAWGIVTSGQSRIKKMKNLEGKTIAYDRNTSAEHFMEAAIKESGATGVMHPQINSLRVRASMVEENQVDAAILPEPYLQEAVALGCAKVYDVPVSQAAKGHILFSRTAMKQKGFHAKLDLLKDAYNQAVDSLNERGVKDILPMLQRVYGLSPDIAQKLKLPRYQKKSANVSVKK